MAAGSVGLQIGAQDARIILLVMTDAGLQAILKDQFKLEAGANVTFGLYGGGVSTGSTTDVNQDILAFSHSRGIFGGGALEGAVIEPRHDWNAAYYDTPGILPRTILFETPVANPVSRPLIQALQAPVGGGG
nr:lipid-binding SYLF domain-containing protein [Roseospira navarrensis]